jgi:hypothetical protein
MPRPTLAVALALACLAPSTIAAQAPARPDEIQPGARVRVTAPGVVAARFVGTVLSRNGDTLNVASPNVSPFAVPTSRITSLEVSRGKSHADGAIRGVKWGAPIGLALGLLTIGVVGDCIGCIKAESNKSGAQAAWLGMNAFGGAIWGAGIGALVGREHWEPFDVQRHAALGVRPGGASFALRYEF